MERYKKFVGKRVEAHYRAGDIELSAEGKLVSDTGKSVFIEERHSFGDKQKTIRAEIPYEFILRVLEPQTNERVSPSASSVLPGPVQRKRP